MRVWKSMNRSSIEYVCYLSFFLWKTFTPTKLFTPFRVYKRTENNFCNETKGLETFYISRYVLLREKSNSNNYRHEHNMLRRTFYFCWAIWLMIENIVGIRWWETFCFTFRSREQSMTILAPPNARLRRRIT